MCFFSCGDTAIIRDNNRVASVGTITRRALDHTVRSNPCQDEVRNALRLENAFEWARIK